MECNKVERGREDCERGISSKTRGTRRGLYHQWNPGDTVIKKDGSFKKETYIYTCYQVYIYICSRREVDNLLNSVNSEEWPQRELSR